MKAIIASCGPKHYIAIDRDDFLPHSWGDNELNRCGLDVEQRMINAPTKVEPFPSMLKEKKLQLQHV